MKMTFEEMLNWTKRFKEIMACNDIAIQKARLKVMQVDLEKTYNIPLVWHEIPRRSSTTNGIISHCD